jgi:hypothetical protein
METEWPGNINPGHSIMLSNKHRTFGVRVTMLERQVHFSDATFDRSTPH